MPKRTTISDWFYKTNTAPMQAIEELKGDQAATGFRGCPATLGALLQRSGDNEGAVAAFRSVARLRPQDADAHNNLGLALIQSGDAAGSIPEFESAIRIKPDDGSYIENLGTAYLQKTDFDSAITQFQPL